MSLSIAIAISIPTCLFLYVAFSWFIYNKKK